MQAVEKLKAKGVSTEEDVLAVSPSCAKPTTVTLCYRIAAHLFQHSNLQIEDDK